VRVARPEESVTIGAALIRWVANRVMAAFQMGLTVTPIEGGAHLTVTLEHELSRRRQAVPALEAELDDVEHRVEGEDGIDENRRCQQQQALNQR